MERRRNVAEVGGCPGRGPERAPMRIASRRRTWTSSRLQPARFHTDQVLAAWRPAMRAVLCEKPLATTAEQARAASRPVQRLTWPWSSGRPCTPTTPPTWRRRSTYSRRTAPTLVRSLSTSFQWRDDLPVYRAGNRSGLPGPPIRTGRERELSCCEAASGAWPFTTSRSYVGWSLFRRMSPWPVPSNPGVHWWRSVRLRRLAQLIAVMPGHWGPVLDLHRHRPGYELSVTSRPHMSWRLGTVRLETTAAPGSWDGPGERLSGRVAPPHRRRLGTV